MPKLHATVLRHIAPLVAEAFRTDPEVAELLDPAVFVGADEDDYAAAVVERLQLTEVMSGVEITDGNPAGDRSIKGAPIAILVMDSASATFYRVPDPRTDPGTWPWMEVAVNPV